MTKKDFVITDKDQGITWITMNRPEALNALTLEMLDGVREAVLAADHDPEVGVIVITGTGRAWCTGLDLKALGQIEFKGGAVGPVIDNCGRALIEAIESASKIVIAAVNGWVFTGGLELLLCTDIIIASEDAQFGDTHCKFGIRPSWGMSQRLPRIIGINRARYHTFTAQNITARQAMEYGLVSSVVPETGLREEVERVAAMIMKNSRDAIAANKALYNRGWQTTLREGLENVEYRQSFEINDTNERLAQFLK
ncbi:MAG: enoyl-CoA hydratase/isomerase family protein [Syntrophomonadaceae bacterium]|nr:enoyl-CoA hydratase/isomerase family protein [Syntrophomonadaceae bacterium]